MDNTKIQHGLNDREKRVVYDEAKAQDFLQKLMPKLQAWDVSSEKQQEKSHETRVGLVQNEPKNVSKNEPKNVTKIGTKNVTKNVVGTAPNQENKLVGQQKEQNTWKPAI